MPSVAGFMPSGGTGSNVTVQNLRCYSSVVTSVNSSTSSVELLGSQVERCMATLFNDSTADLYVKYGAGASQSDFSVKIKPQAYYELPLPCYTGQISGAWSAANGSVKVTSFTY